MTPKDTTVDESWFDPKTLEDILYNLAWNGTHTDADQRVISDVAITEAKAALESHYREKYLGIVLGCEPTRWEHEDYCDMVNTDPNILYSSVECCCQCADFNKAIDTYTHNIKNKFEEAGK